VFGVEEGPHRGSVREGVASEHEGNGKRDVTGSSQGLRWAIFVLVVVFAFLWFVPRLQVENFSQKVPADDRPALVNEYRRTWAQIIGGFGLLLGLYFTWRRIEISQQELEATRDQQVTERFTRAIDQLGATDNEGKNKKLEIRLGGIFALERIAVDSFAMENSSGRRPVLRVVRWEAAGPLLRRPTSLLAPRAPMAGAARLSTGGQLSHEGVPIAVEGGVKGVRGGGEVGGGGFPSHVGPAVSVHRYAEALLAASGPPRNVE
jgi:hypothetical protein